MRRVKFALAAATLLLVTACSPPATPDIWSGETVAADSGAIQALRLEVQNHSGRWLGSYLVDAARGAFDGTLASDGSLTATLTAAATCTFYLTGAVTGDVLPHRLRRSIAQAEQGAPGPWSGSETGIRGTRDRPVRSVPDCVPANT